MMSACRRSAAQLGQAGDEVGADEAGLARHLGGKRGESLLGDRVAVDPDQRPRGPQPVGDQASMATAADGAVDAHLARLRVDEVDQLAGEDRDVRLGHVKQCGQEMR